MDQNGNRALISERKTSVNGYYGKQPTRYIPPPPAMALPRNSADEEEWYSSIVSEGIWVEARAHLKMGLWRLFSIFERPIGELLLLAVWWDFFFFLQEDSAEDRVVLALFEGGILHYSQSMATYSDANDGHDDYLQKGKHLT